MKPKHDNNNVINSQENPYVKCRGKVVPVLKYHAMKMDW